MMLINLLAFTNRTFEDIKLLIAIALILNLNRLLEKTLKVPGIHAFTHWIVFL